MSVLIKGMEMPASCCQCPVNMYLCKRGYEYLLEHPTLYDERAKDCPLVPVPQHGRLIDADALGDFPYNMDFCDGGEADEWVRNAPTILEAEEGEA